MLGQSNENSLYENRCENAREAMIYHFEVCSYRKIEELPVLSLELIVDTSAWKIFAYYFEKDGAYCSQTYDTELVFVSEPFLHAVVSGTSFGRSFLRWTSPQIFDRTLQ